MGGCDGPLGGATAAQDHAQAPRANGVSIAAIRAYESRDLEACRRLWEELTEWHRELYGRPEISGPGSDAYLERVGAENVWVAESDGSIAGLAGLIVDGSRGEIEPVVVAAGHRGRGIGRALVEAVVAEARRRGLRQLKVRPVARNEAALAFFQRSGFDVLGHVDLLLDLVPRERGDWREGERLAGVRFRV
jgi:GNAT superfamily N-acetyltransferase